MFNLRLFLGASAEFVELNDELAGNACFNNSSYGSEGGGGGELDDDVGGGEKREVLHYAL